MRSCLFQEKQNKNVATLNEVFQLYWLTGSLDCKGCGPLMTGCCTLNDNTHYERFSNIWKWVFYVAVKEIWPTHLCRIVLIHPHWRAFEDEWSFQCPTTTCERLFPMFLDLLSTLREKMMKTADKLTFLFKFIKPVLKVLFFELCFISESSLCSHSPPTCW